MLQMTQMLTGSLGRWGTHVPLCVCVFVCICFRVWWIQQRVMVPVPDTGQGGSLLVQERTVFVESHGLNVALHLIHRNVDERNSRQLYGLTFARKRSFLQFDGRIHAMTPFYDTMLPLFFPSSSNGHSYLFGSYTNFASLQGFMTEEVILLLPSFSRKPLRHLSTSRHPIRPCMIHRSMCSAGDDARRAQAARFEAEVERKGKALLKANRKLARDVSQWVNASMARHDEAVSTGELGTGGDGVELGPSARDAQNMNVEDEGNGCGGVEEMKGRDGMEREGDGQSVGGGGVSAWLGGWLR